MKIIMLLVLCGACAPAIVGLTHPIKIGTGVVKTGERKASDGLSYIPPTDASGPEALFFLNGKCFSSLMDRYEYTICPFQNVTQRRITAGPRATLLGVYEGWAVANSSAEFKHMMFGKGATCGKASRQATVEFMCLDEATEGEVEFSLLRDGVKEVNSCEFELRFLVPLSCSLLKADVIVLPLTAGDSLQPADPL